MAKNEELEALFKIITGTVVNAAFDVCKRKEHEKWNEAPFTNVAKEYIAEKDVFGFRWYVDEQNQIYVARIQINTTFHNDFTKSGLLAFYTEDCTITHIITIPEISLVDEIPGNAAAYAKACIEVKCGTKIQNQRTYFYMNLHDLIVCEGLEINRNGKQIIIPLSPFEIDTWIKNLSKQINDLIRDEP